MAVQFVKSSVIPFGPAPSSETGALRTVELCGRTAYKSEDKITETSAKSFVLMLKSHGHLSVLEHSNVVLRVAADGAAPSCDAVLKALRDRLPFHRLYSPDVTGDGGFFICGNFRAWIETIAFLERDPSLRAFFSNALNRFFPSLFEPGPASSEDLSRSVSLVDEDGQIALLKKNEALDLPAFIFKIVCDHVDTLAPIGEFFGPAADD